MKQDFCKSLSAFLSGKRIVILGYGREGKTSLELIRALGIHAQITVADIKKPDTDKNPELTDGSVKVIYGEDYLFAIKDCDVVLKSPGIALFDMVDTEDRGKITSQTDLFLRFCSNKIIGVTGTKGKSTTSSLIYHFLTASGIPCRLIGNIGIPPFTAARELSGGETVVCEMSSHQLEFLSASPHIALLLNIFPEHLDHYVSFEAYASAKMNIYRYQNAWDYTLYPSDCTHIDRAELDSLPQSKIPLSIGAGGVETHVSASGDGISLNIDGQAVYIPSDRLVTSLLGIHNRYNIAAALAASLLAGADLDSCLASLPSFRSLPHRLEYVGEYGGIRWYNDSIATIPEAAMRSVESVGRVDTLIIGGLDRGVDYVPFARFLSESGIATVIALPESGHKVADMMTRRAGQSVVKVDTLDRAVEYAKSATPKCGVCLLSPAAASYGYFKNFEERGEHFRELVRK